MRELDEVIMCLRGTNGLGACVEELLKVLRGGFRVYVSGNGGSASTASHFSADLSALGFNSICLNDSIPRVTAITNDYGWSRVYVDQLKFISQGDILVLFTVHGGEGCAEGEDWSINLVEAYKMCSGLGVKTIVFSGCLGGYFRGKENVLLLPVDSGNPYVVEGVQSVIAHMICVNLKEKLK